MQIQVSENREAQAAWGNKSGKSATNFLKGVSTVGLRQGLTFH